MESWLNWMMNSNDNNFVSEFRSSERTVICSKIQWSENMLAHCHKKALGKCNNADLLFYTFHRLFYNHTRLNFIL